MSVLIAGLFAILNYLSPPDLSPYLITFQVMPLLTVVGLIAAFLSYTSNPSPFRAPQVGLLVGLVGAMMLSNLMKGWPGGALFALTNIFPAIVIFFMLIGGVDSLPRLRFFALCILGVAVYLVARIASAYLSGDLESPFLLVSPLREGPDEETVGLLIRGRGQGLLNDPNDFGQFLVFNMPLLWLFWWSGNFIWNFFVVLVPAGWLAYGVFLTRSRGALVSAVIMVALVLRHRFGKFGSTVIGVGLFLGVVASNFTGRALSVGGGSDRLALWSDGLGMFKQSPIWGVGYRSYADFAELTAHNSFILVLAELGLIGLFFWISLFLLSYYHLRSVVENPNLSPAVTRTAQVLEASMWGYLASAMFISRAYVNSPYLLLGLFVALHQVVRNYHPDFQPYQNPKNWPRRTIMIALGFVAFVYVAVNLR